LLVLGCANQIPLRNDYVATNPSLFQSNSLKEKRVILVIDSYLLNYRLTKSLYNSVGGNLAPDQVSFEIGHALAHEISNMCKNLFGSVKEVSNFKRASEESGENINLIIIPEISNAEIFFPSVGFADITAEITVKYSFYNSSGNLINTEVVLGKGAKRLTSSRMDYQLAMESALEDLMRKSKTVFIKVLK
jgi:hypothetical protein